MNAAASASEARHIMLPVLTAERLILQLIQPLSAPKATEVVTLADALGRVLAEPVTSQLDVPHWDNAAMDGYAVRFQDVKTADGEHPVVLELLADIPAGTRPQQSVQSGQAARIFTGAMMPEGADTVVMQENTHREAHHVTILAAPSRPKSFVRQRGDYYQAGQPLLSAGIRLAAADLAVLAAVQCTPLTMVRRPKVAIFSTGDELVTPDQPLGVGQIVDSNQTALGAFVQLNGGIPLRFGIVPDRQDRLRATMQQAIAQGDMVLSTGGVSVGDYDYVEPLLAELGGEIHIRKVAIKPGKPLTVARFPNGCVYFGIPGNPVSALVSCWRFVQPALRKLSGLRDGWGPSFVEARSLQALHSGGQRETYLWGQLSVVNGAFEFCLARGRQQSANLMNLSQTNGLAVLPVGQTDLPVGAMVSVMQVGEAIANHHQ